MGASQFSWQYGPSGQVTLQNEQDAGTSEGTISRRYDSADRLLGTTTPAGQLGYDYDGAGQILRKSVSMGRLAGSGSVTTSHNTGRRQPLIGVCAFNRSIPSIKRSSFATNSVVVAGATRTARSVFQWGAGIGLIRQEHWADGDTGPGTPTALLLPLQGHLGTSLEAVDAHGQVVETISHDAFGQRTDASAAAQSHRFAGEYWDEDAQLVYLRARWYDPKIGGFISADPFEGQQDNPRSLNRYSYASNDPTNSTDPSGRMTIGESSVATAVVATVAAMAPSTAFAGGMGDLSNSEKKFFAEMYSEQVLKLPTDNVMRNVRGYAMVNGARIDLEFDRVFIDPSRSYIKVAEVKWGQNSQYTTNQRIASLQITQGDIYLTGPQAASNRINPNKTLKEQFGYQHVIFTVNGTRVLRSDIPKVA